MHIVYNTLWKTIYSNLIPFFCLLNPCPNRVQTATMDYSSSCDEYPCPAEHTYWCHSHNHWWHHWLSHSIEKPAQAKHQRLLQWHKKRGWDGWVWLCCYYSCSASLIPRPLLSFHCLEYSVVLLSFYFGYTNCWNGCHRMNGSSICDIFRFYLYTHRSTAAKHLHH